MLSATRRAIALARSKPLPYPHRPLHSSPLPPPPSPLSALSSPSPPANILLTSSSPPPFPSHANPPLVLPPSSLHVRSFSSSGGEPLLVLLDMDECLIHSQFLSGTDYRQ